MSIVAIIVLYETELSFLQNLDTILKQCDKLILIDNGCIPEFRTKLSSRMLRYDDKIIYHREPNNIGLGLAQNHGIEMAEKYSPEFLLFFDDDSLPSENFSNALMIFAANNKEFGIVAPEILHVSGGVQKYWIREGLFWIRRGFKEGEDFLPEVNTVISSGSLIPMRIIREVGYMRDDFFIDYLDIEYCLRVRKAGYKITVLKSAKLTHNLGERKLIFFLGTKISPTNHSSKRKHFMTRNRIVTWRIYGVTFPAWLIIDILNFLYDTIRTLVFEKDKLSKAKSILTGFYEGVWFSKYSIRQSS